MGEEREDNNLTLEKLRKVMEPYILMHRKADKLALDAYDQIKEFYSIQLGDYIVIHGSWFIRFPNPKPIWLKASYMVPADEALIVRGTPMRHSQI